MLYQLSSLCFCARQQGGCSRTQVFQPLPLCRDCKLYAELCGHLFVQPWMCCLLLQPGPAILLCGQLLASQYGYRSWDWYLDQIGIAIGIRIGICLLESHSAIASYKRNSYTIKTNKQTNHKINVTCSTQPNHAYMTLNCSTYLRERKLITDIELAALS